MTARYMAIDQHGATQHGLEYPRRDLLRRHQRQHAERIYVDKPGGRSVCIGWIVAGHWYTVYKVAPMERAA